MLHVHTRTAACVGGEHSVVFIFLRDRDGGGYGDDKAPRKVTAGRDACMVAQVSKCTVVKKGDEGEKV